MFKLDVYIFTLDYTKMEFAVGERKFTSVGLIHFKIQPGATAKNAMVELPAGIITRDPAIQWSALPKESRRQLTKSWPRSLYFIMVNIPFIGSALPPSILTPTMLTCTVYLKNIIARQSSNL